MSVTVGEIFGIIDAFAPFDTAMEGDNVGLLVGRMDRPVDTVLTALDATPAVVREAQAHGAQLLITHHPLMFSPIQRLDEADPEAALLGDIMRAGLSMIAAHTNLDLAQGGVNDVLAQRVGWPVTRVDGILRLGAWDTPQRLGDLQDGVAAALADTVLRYGDADERVMRFAICSGGGSSEVAHAVACGTQVFLTGEVKHDRALYARAMGMAVLAAGHRASEKCAADLLADHLQSALDAVQSKVRVLVSTVDPFA